MGDIVTTVTITEGNETENRGRYSKAGVYSSKTITANGHKTTSVHDVLNATRKITSPKGRTITSVYDPDTLLVSQVTQPGLSALPYTYYPEGSAHAGRIQTMTTGSRTVQYALRSKVSGKMF